MTSFLSRHREVAIAAATTVLSLGGLAAVGTGGWPGEAFDCHTSPCYCEASQPGFFRQPSNTWSNLAAVGAGLWVAGWFGRLRRTEQNLPPGVVVLGLVFPGVLVFQGVGSMAFHGSLTVWGSAIDAMSMFGSMGLLATTNLHRLGVFGARQFALAWAALVAFGLALGLTTVSGVTNLLFLMFLFILGSEVALSRLRRAPSQGFLRLGLGLHVTSVTIWFLSASDLMPLCLPTSLLQGHAVWHLLEAIVVSLFAVHAVTNLRAVGAERPLREQVRVPAT